MNKKATSVVAEQGSRWKDGKLAAGTNELYSRGAVAELGIRWTTIGIVGS